MSLSVKRSQFYNFFSQKYPKHSGGQGVCRIKTLAVIFLFKFEEKYHVNEYLVHFIFTRKLFGAYTWQFLSYRLYDSLKVQKMTGKTSSKTCLCHFPWNF